jgi:hemerythrin
MDHTHREFVDIVESMLAATDDGVAARLEAFIEHAEAHFEQEREWMAATDFPAMQCHIDEHNAVLKSTYEVRDMIAAGGDIAAGRSLANELVRWFPGHADYLDAPLAQWMTKKRLGGTPVVLRRGVAVAL